MGAARRRRLRNCPIRMCYGDLGGVQFVARGPGKRVTASSFPCGLIFGRARLVGLSSVSFVVLNRGRVPGVRIRLTGEV
jgi:hypothetical protein